MNSTELINKLVKEFPLYISNNQHQIECLRMQITINQHLSAQRNIVYVAGPTMPQPTEFSKDCLFILYSPDKKIPDTVNTLVYTDPDIFIELCEAIHIGLINHEEYTKKEHQLHQIFRLTSSLSTLLKECYELLHNPLLINDAAFKCLGTWPSAPIGLRKFDQMVMQGYAQKDFLESAEEIIRLTSKYNLQGTSAINFMYYDELMTIAVSPIYYQENVIGGIEIIEHETPISETDIQVLNLIALLLPLEMLKHLYHGINYGNAYDQLFYDLVSLQPRNYEKMEKRLHEIDFLHSSYQILYVDIPLENNYLPHLFINELKELFPSCNIVLLEHAVILFIEPHYLTEEMYAQLDKFSSEHDELVCVSDVYINLLETHILVSQLKAMALFLVNKGSAKGVHHFKEYRFSTMLSMLPQKEVLNEFIHPSLLTLIKYDEEHHSNLLDTLKQYLLYQCNAAECAKQMDIHRNSLIYRIEKISKIMNLSLNNPYDCFNLLTSIYLYESTHHN